jgi:hypothetical protein
MEMWISFSASTCLILKLAEAVMTYVLCYGDDRFESRLEHQLFRQIFHDFRQFFWPDIRVIIQDYDDNMLQTFTI